MFYVGQKVVSLVTQSNNVGVSMTKGQIFTVLGNYECTCGCQYTDIGLASPVEYDYSICLQCGKAIYTGGITVCEAKDLAPLQDIEADIEELCERILREVEINEPLTVY